MIFAEMKDKFFFNSSKFPCLFTIDMWYMYFFQPRIYCYKIMLDKSGKSFGFTKKPWKITFWFCISYYAIYRFLQMRFYENNQECILGTLHHMVSLFVYATIYFNGSSHLHVYACAVLISYKLQTALCSEIIWHFIVHGLFNSVRHIVFLIRPRYFHLEYNYTWRFVVERSAWYMACGSTKYCKS